MQTLPSRRPSQCIVSPSPPPLPGLPVDRCMNHARIHQVWESNCYSRAPIWYLSEGMGHIVCLTSDSLARYSSPEGKAANSAGTRLSIERSDISTSRPHSRARMTTLRATSIPVGWDQGYKQCSQMKEERLGLEVVRSLYKLLLSMLRSPLRSSRGSGSV